ncbi:Fc.00g094450.m01.CDS01 [Cosmosporella sp. VM-42]
MGPLRWSLLLLSLSIATAWAESSMSTIVRSTPPAAPTGVRGRQDAKFNTIDIYVYPKPSSANASYCVNEPEPYIRTVSYYVLDGWAIIDGDVIYGTEADILAAAVGGNGTSKRDLEGRSISIPPTDGRKWPGGVLLYKWAGGVIPATQAKFLAAAKMWTDRLPFLEITLSSDPSAVVVGEVPGDDLSYATRGCCGGSILLGTSSSLAWAAHSIGHTLGLEHEHQRPDRDYHINVDCNAIMASTCGATWTGWASYFDIVQSPGNWDYAGAYDVDSIMHFNAWDFAAGATPVITGKPGIFFKPSGRDFPTLPDSRHVCELYWEHCHAICGDGIWSPQFEVCEDGNNLDGDGCSADCQEGPLCLGTCTPGALPPTADACAYGAGRATCEIFNTGGGTPRSGNAFCFCQAGYRADGADPTNTKKQYRLDWSNSSGGQTHRVVVAPGQTCNTLCNDVNCSEVPIQNECD